MNRRILLRSTLFAAGIASAAQAGRALAYRPLISGDGDGEGKSKKKHRKHRRKS